MLSDLPSGVLVALLVRIRLNAPYGAPCFLTSAPFTPVAALLSRLNTPYGAPRYLTGCGCDRWRHVPFVLIHLMAFHAF